MFKRYVHSKSLFFIIFIFLVTKDVIKTVCVHLQGNFPIFLLRMNVSRYLLNVPIGKINIVQTFKKRKLSKLCFILAFQVVLITTLKNLILLRKQRKLDIVNRFLFLILQEHICQQYLLLETRSVQRKKRKETFRFICLPIPLYSPYK